MASSPGSRPVPPVVSTSTVSHDTYLTSPSSSSSVSEDGQASPSTQAASLGRPTIGTRKTSGTIIIPRDSPNVEASEEQYAEGDARTMSPRRSSEEIEKLGREARQALIDQAKVLQASLLDICDRVESIKTEHTKLEGENRFLQNYIGELMQTTKITSTGAQKNKNKGRSNR